MARKWQVQEAKVRFSALVEASLRDGPQVVTRRGVETAMLVPIDEWRRMAGRARPSLKDLLLAPEPRVERLVPLRSKHRRRAGVRVVAQRIGFQDFRRSDA